KSCTCYTCRRRTTYSSIRRDLIVDALCLRIVAQESVRCRQAHADQCHISSYIISGACTHHGQILLQKRQTIRGDTSGQLDVALSLLESVVGCVECPKMTHCPLRRRVMVSK